MVSTGFEVSWWTVDGGGGPLSGGGYSLDGTIGQPDAAGWSGAAFTLDGGFWPRSQLIFADGFEGGSTSLWSAAVGGAP